MSTDMSVKHSSLLGIEARRLDLTGATAYAHRAHVRAKEEA